MEDISFPLEPYPARMTVTKTWAWASHALSWQDRSQFQCKSWEHTALSYDYETQPPSQPACALGSTTGWCRCMRLGAVLCPINLEHGRSVSTCAAAWPDRPEQLFFQPGLFFVREVQGQEMLSASSTLWGSHTKQLSPQKTLTHPYWLIHWMVWRHHSNK